MLNRNYFILLLSIGLTLIKRILRKTFSFLLPKPLKIQVKVNQGIIIGCEDTLPDGRKFSRFSGIRYAVPPIGKLRFQPPQKLLKFENDELDCTHERDACFHESPIWRGTHIGSEDCLHLNVYVPSSANLKNKLPVLFYIHGGGFMINCNSTDFYSPEHLLMEDIIVVVINYRLHVLGFLSLPSMGISGNNGLKDQQMALEWVHENITHFNGDPNKICIFGESAGSASVHLQVLNEKSRQFMSSAICQSGTAMCDWVFQRNAPDKARKLAKILGCNGAPSDEDCIETLMAASPKELYKNCLKVLTADERRRNMHYAFKPVIEPESENAFMTKHPVELIKIQKGQINIPIIFGTTTGEGMMMVSDYRKKLDLFDKKMTRVIPFSLNLQPDNPVAEKVAQEIKQFYFGTQKICEKTICEFVQLITDYHFTIGLTMANELHAIYQPGSKQYLYEFAFEGRLNFYKVLLGMSDIPGVCHYDDVPHLFNSQIIGYDVSINSRAGKMRREMCKMWGNFAKYGNPSPNIKDPQWMPVQRIENGSDVALKYFIINETFEMKENIHNSRINLWRQIYLKFNGSFLNVIYDEPGDDEQ